MLNQGLLNTISDESTDKNQIDYNIGGNIVIGQPDEAIDEWIEEDFVIEIDEEEIDIEVDEVIPRINTLGDLDSLRELRDQIHQQRSTEEDNEDLSIDTLFT